LLNSPVTVCYHCYNCYMLYQ